MGYFPVAAAAAASLALVGAVAAQSPRQALNTSDVDLFFRLYDASDGRLSAGQIQADYIERGSDGLRTFLEARGTTAQRIADALEARPELYRRARDCAAALPVVQERVDEAVARLAALYPPTRTPEVTVAVGRGRPVAIASPVDGIQVGLEALCAADFIEPDIEDRFVSVLVHEFVHAQQDAGLIEKETRTVLELALLEGGAEFVTELLIGRPAYAYFEPLTAGREAEIEAAFAADIDRTDVAAWFYNSTPERPGDLGYWVGHRIARTHYENAADKGAALREILTFTDARAFSQPAAGLPARLRPERRRRSADDVGLSLPCALF